MYHDFWFILEEIWKIYLVFFQNLEFSKIWHWKWEIFKTPIEQAEEEARIRNAKLEELKRRRWLGDDGDVLGGGHGDANGLFDGSDVDPNGRCLYVDNLFF